MSRMTVRFASPGALALVLVLALAAPAWPHHSFAMFDATKPLTLKGTVRQFQWTNPHCFVQLVVPSPGGATEWSLEMNSPTASYRSGWRPRTYRAGDELTVVVHPLRDGKPGGQLVSATDARGRTLPLVAAKP